MLYDMLPLETVHKVWDTFLGHSACNNQKYFDFKGTNTFWNTDRERFVGRLFRKYEGKHIILIDKKVVGYNYDNYVAINESPVSVYSNSYHTAWGVPTAEPLLRVQKTYLHINGFQAINELYGLGYIEMNCTDALGTVFKVRLDHNNMLHLQFKEITELEFQAVARMFEDDRSDRAYKVTRYLMPEEIKYRNTKNGIRKKVKTHLIEEQTIVKAKDIDEARTVLANTIKVEPA